MNTLIAILMGIIITMAANAEDESGIIGRAYEDGMPVIYKFVNERRGSPKPTLQLFAEGL